MIPRVTIVIPAYNEGESIVLACHRLADAVSVPFVARIVVDTPDDTTIPYVAKVHAEDPRFDIQIQDYGRGPANAIRYGMDHSETDVVVVSMADGSDDVRVIDDLVRLVERGFVIAAASRYMAGGGQVGGPVGKGMLSRTAGRSLGIVARVGTQDATNSFKAYSTQFVRDVGIESRDGFEMALELVAKARRYRLPVAEIPSIWLDRTEGESNFQLRAWLPQYLKWYRYAFGPKKTLSDKNHPGESTK